MSKIIGFTCGSFDLCHAGHVRMFQECKEHCNYLIVGVQDDPSFDRPQKNKPIQSYVERIELVSAIKYIDQIVLYSTEEDLYKLLKVIMPTVRFVGEDWRDKPFTGHDLPIKIIYNNRDHGFSTSELRERVWKAEQIKRALIV